MIIFDDFKQGSEEWHKVRLGIPTASGFSRIVTAKGALSSTRFKYQCELLAEKTLGYPVADYTSDWMMRGSDLEEQAISYYELQRNIDVRVVAFCMTDDRKVGCSPDGLIGDDGGLEIKCPGPIQHIANLLDKTIAPIQQVQGALWVTGRKWWDILSYHPELPPALVRVLPDPAYQAALGRHLRAFISGLDGLWQQLREQTSVGSEGGKTLDFTGADTGSQL